MQEFFSTIFEWLKYGLGGTWNLLSFTGSVAIIGSGIALVVGAIANIIFWPIFLVKNRSKTTK